MGCKGICKIRGRAWVVGEAGSVPVPLKLLVVAGEAVAEALSKHTTGAARENRCLPVASRWVGQRAGPHRPCADNGHKLRLCVEPVCQGWSVSDVRIKHERGYAVKPSD